MKVSEMKKLLKQIGCRKIRDGEIMKYGTAQSQTENSKSHGINHKNCQLEPKSKSEKSQGYKP